MSTVSAHYVREMHQKFDQFACWPPNTPLRLGDVGILRRHRFDKVTTLAQLGLRSPPDETGEPALLEYMSAGQVRVAVDGEARSGPVLASAGARVSISFDRANATFFQAVDAVRETITDLPKLDKSLRPLLARRIWKPEWAVVTSVQRAAAVLVLVSERQDAKAELTIEVDAPGEALPLAGAAARIGFKSLDGMGFRFAAADGTTPLFGAAQFGRRITGVGSLTFRAGATGLADLGWEDVVDAE